MKQRKNEEAKKLKEAQIKKEMKHKNKIDKILSNENANAPLIKKEQLDERWISDQNRKPNKLSYYIAKLFLYYKNS